MSGEKSYRCFLSCGESATIEPRRARNGSIKPESLVSCEKCGSYIIPSLGDIKKKLEALSPGQRVWIAREVRKRFDADPSNPYRVDEAAIRVALDRAK